MRLPDMEFVAPASVAEACRSLAEARTAQVIAGGTDLLVALKEGQKAPARLVDLAGLPELGDINFSEENGIEIGALVTLRRLTAEPVIRNRFPALAHAAALVATPQIRSAATVGGNLCQDSCCMYFNRPVAVRQPLPPCHKLGGSICHVVPTSPACWAPYAGDLAPVLMVLGAEVEIAGQNGMRTAPLAAVYSDDGARPLTLAPDEFITKLRCKTPAARFGAAYVKLRPRETMDYPIVGVAASVALGAEEQDCIHAAVVLTGVASAPKAVEEAEVLARSPLSAEAIAKTAAAATKLAYPVKNVVGSEPGYRRAMVSHSATRALNEALAAALASEQEP